MKISLFSFLEMILVYKRIYRYVLCVTVFLEILKETKDACTCNRVKWSRGLRPSLHTRVQWHASTNTGFSNYLHELPRPFRQQTGWNNARLTISPCPPLNGKTTLTLQKNLWHGGCIILPRAYLTVDLDEVRHQSWIWVFLLYIGNVQLQISIAS